MDRDNQSYRMKNKATEFNSSPESSDDSFKMEMMEKLMMDYRLSTGRVLQHGFGDRSARLSAFNDSASSSSSNQVPARTFNRPNIRVETTFNEKQPSFSNYSLQRGFDDRNARVISSFNESTSSSSSNQFGDLSLAQSLNRLNIGGDNSYKPSGGYSFSRTPGPPGNSRQTRRTLTFDHMISSQPNSHDKNYEGSPDDTQNIFSSVIHRVVELSMNPDENQTVVNFLNVCTREERWKIISEITANPRQLLIMCFDTHGNSVVKKLIETAKDCKSVLPLTRALKPGVVDLINHDNGHNIIESCLKHFLGRVNEFIFEAAITHCYEISTHKNGCHVMQSIIGYPAGGVHQQALIHKISELAYNLALNPYGNYVVKHVINRKIQAANALLMSHLSGHFVSLSTSKFGSHVVEDCISKIPESRRMIVYELLNTDDDDFNGLLRHSFANYVVQSALGKKEDNDLHGLLVQRVCYHIHTLKGTAHYKKMRSLVMLML